MNVLSGMLLVFDEAGWSIDRTLVLVVCPADPTSSCGWKRWWALSTLHGLSPVSLNEKWLQLQCRIVEDVG
jgi:hypothetical protein